MSEEWQDAGFPGMSRAINSMASHSGWGFDPLPLNDKVIAAVEASEDKELLVFRLDDGRTITYRVEGDCCSTSWIEHLTVPTDIAGATVTAFAEHEMGEKWDDGECIRRYDTSFVTPKGEIVVEYRNSSNGYYGGSLEGPVEQWAIDEAREMREAAALAERGTE